MGPTGRSSPWPVILLVSVKYTIPDVVTGMIGVILLAAAFLTSVVVNRRTRT